MPLSCKTWSTAQFAKKFEQLSSLDKPRLRKHIRRCTDEHDRGTEHQLEHSTKNLLDVMKYSRSDQQVLECRPVWARLMNWLSIRYQSNPFPVALGSPRTVFEAGSKRLPDPESKNFAAAIARLVRYQYHPFHDQICAWISLTKAQILMFTLQSESSSLARLPSNQPISSKEPHPPPSVEQD